MINEQYERAKQILTEHKDGHAQLAQLLVEREVIFADDVEKIFGKRPWTSRSEELLEAQQRAEAEAMAKRRAEELGLPFHDSDAPEAPETPGKSDEQDSAETPEPSETK
jgi:cell division protease FtsH